MGHYFFKVFFGLKIQTDRGFMKPMFSIVGLLILVLSLSSCGMFGGKLSNQELVKHDGSSTVALVRYDTENEDDVSDIKVFCSAVWVDDTHILTAFHCVKAIQEILQEEEDQKEANKPPCEGIEALLGLCDPNAVVKHKVIELQDMPMHFVQWKEAESPGLEPTAWHLSQVSGWDKRHDLALLTAVGQAIPAHESATLAKDVPGLGEHVHSVGHPRGLYWTFLEGTVAGYRGSIAGVDDIDGPFLQVQAPIYYGNSGGGAFNDYGELIGTADFLMGVPSEGFYIPVVSIRNFLHEQGLQK